jgi:hypothetical protein
MGTAKGGRWAPVAQAWIEHPQVGADELAVLTVLSLPSVPMMMRHRPPGSLDLRA